MNIYRSKKAKCLRALKILFYSLGFPLFVLAVMALASQNYGHLPFSGDPGGGLFDAINVFFNSPAMYCVWIALLVWAAVTLVQIVCALTMKKVRMRALTVLAAALVFVLVPVFVIDAVYEARVERITASAPDGVTVETYKHQLAYYHTHTGGGRNAEANGKRTSLTDSLVERTENFCKVYNIAYYGDYKDSPVNNSTNQPLYYDELLYGSAVGYDYTADGVVNEYDHRLVDVTFDPDEAGEYDDGKYYFDTLTVTDKNGENPVSYEGNFFCMIRKQAVPTTYNTSDTEMMSTYVWYDGDRGSFELAEGLFGAAYYNKNGLMSDDYVFSAAVTLNILEAYYSTQATMEANLDAFQSAAGISSDNDLTDTLELVRQRATATREDRYTNAANPDYLEEDYYLWLRETSTSIMEGYLITQSELTSLLQLLGSELGGARLLRDLLDIDLISSAIGGFLNLEDLLGGLLGEELAGSLLAKLGLTGVTVSVSYDDALSGIVLSFSGGCIATPRTVTLNGDFSLEPLAEVIGDVLGTTPAESQAVIVDVLGLVGLSAASCDPINSKVITAADELSATVTELLFNLYWYASPVLDTIYGYYDDGFDLSGVSNAQELEAATAFLSAAAVHDQAVYEGSMHGYLIGSRLIGPTLGLGTYSAEYGLTDLAAVQQLKTDLSYQPEMYSILLVRDALEMFACGIMLFLALYYIFAEKEELLYAGLTVEKEGGAAGFDEDNIGDDAAGEDEKGAAGVCLQKPDEGVADDE